MPREKKPMSEEAKAQLKARRTMTPDERFEEAIRSGRLVDADHIAQDIVARMWKDAVPQKDERRSMRLWSR